MKTVVIIGGDGGVVAFIEEDEDGGIRAISNADFANIIVDGIPLNNMVVKEEEKTE